MLKLTTVFLTVTMFVTGTMHAQTLSNPSRENQTSLRQAISQETEKFKKESAVVDGKKLERIRQQVPQNGWSTKKTVITVAIVVALVGLVAVIAYNSKRCVRRSPSGCSFSDDINCQCVEYSQ